MTTHTTPIDLRPYHGRECEAVIDNRSIKGKISVNKNGAVFICYNDKTKATWNSVDEMFGYPHSWCVQRPFEQIWRGIDMESITILDEPKSINPEWDWKDGEEVRLSGNPAKRFIIINGNIIHIVSEKGVVKNSGTPEGVYSLGYRKLPPPPSRKLVEITEEVFRSTAWYGKKVIWADKERKIIAVDYETNNLHFGLNRQSHYSQCKLIEE